MADSPGTLCLLREERLLRGDGWGGGVSRGQSTQLHVPVVLAMVPSTLPLRGDLRGRALRGCSLPPLRAFLGDPKLRRGRRGCVSVGLKHRVPLSPLCCPPDIRLPAHFQGANSSVCHSDELLQTGTLSVPGT